MIAPIVTLAASLAGLLLLGGCPHQLGAAPAVGSAAPTTATATSAIDSAFTGLSPPACLREIDKSDPNETPFLLCPGVAGYSLVVRRVDSGRNSIDVVGPTQRRFPLELDKVVTRRMSSLGDKVEWRVAVRDGQRQPVALMIRIKAREDTDDPARVTRTLLVVAKLTPSEVCVTDRQPEGAWPEAEWRRAADDAQTRPCAAALPPVSRAGVVTR